MRKNNGITLIALIITIVVLIILAGVAMTLTLSDNGVLNKAKSAKEETIKQSAIEKMNLKITEVQMDYYGKTQKMPTLQNFVDELCEDNSVQYVKLSKTLASLEKIDVSSADSIYTKFKEYPYEFEIDSSLRLASIDGVKVAENNTTITDYRDNLICEYTMDSVSSSSIEDTTTNNMVAQIYGSGITSNSDNAGKYISFNGDGSYIATDKITKLAGDTPKTICCNFRTTLTSTANSTILNLGAGTDGGSGLIGFNNYGHPRFDTGSGTYLFKNDNINIADNNWHFLAMTYDNNTVVVYLDDKPIHATPATLNTINPNLQIGHMMYAISYVSGFQGDIDNVRAYDKALNINEIYKVYTNGRH